MRRMGDFMVKIGDRFKTIRGDEYVVIKYENCEKVTVEFCDENKHKLTTRADFVVNGKIKNPYSPRLYGVGYFGVGNNRANCINEKGVTVRSPAYQAWSGMLGRCYNEKYSNPHIYEKTVVHASWHCFQSFASWYYSQMIYTGWSDITNLDKDILGDGNVYSEETCCLVPVCINTSIAQKHKNKYLPGVRRISKNSYSITETSDYHKEKFKDEKSAHLAYVKVKSEKIKFVANKYKNFLRPDVYDALMTKDFRYKFSPFFDKPQINNQI